MCGCLDFGKEADKGTELTEPPVEMNKTVTIDVKLPKLTYSVGENFSGEYTVRYNVEPFDILIQETYSRKGFEEWGSIMVDSTPSTFPDLIDAMRNTTYTISAFRQDKRGYCIPADYFLYAGTYLYSISVYDCTTIKKELNTSCENVTLENSKILLRIKPLDKKSVEIIVTGKNIKPECETNEDCTKTCENCVTGKQFCHGCNLACIDCFTSIFDCNEGYECREHKCVKQVIE